MLIGHLAFGFAARGARPTIPLGTLVLAAMLADFLAFALMIASF